MDRTWEGSRLQSHVKILEPVFSSRMTGLGMKALLIGFLSIQCLGNRLSNQRERRVEAREHIEKGTQLVFSASQLSWSE